MQTRAHFPVQVLAAVVVMSSLSARAEEPGADGEETERRSPVMLGGFRVDYGASARASGGYGQLGTTRQLDAGLAVVALDLKPHFSRGGLHLRVPLAFEHQQTFGASLSETRGEAGLDIAYRLGRSLRLGGEAGFTWVRRADWPDPYQPVLDANQHATGELLTSDRFGYHEARAGLGLRAEPQKSVRLEAQYLFRTVGYPQDPAFDPLLEPTHLSPGDFIEHGGRVSAAYEGHDWSVEGRLDAAWRSYDRVYARDAGTGLTHAGPGGLPPNPMQELLEVEPLVRAELKLGREVTLTGGYGLEVQDDLYRGYYSYVGHHPFVAAHYETSRMQARAVVEARLRGYGANGYAASCDAAAMAAGNNCSHPPLDWGDGATSTTGRRRDDRVRISLSGAWSLGAGAAVFLETSYVKRTTNYPDYQPGVYPRTAQYRIDWDYDEARALVGVAYRI